MWHIYELQLVKMRLGFKYLQNSTDYELAFTPRPDATIIDKPIYTCIDKLFIAELAAQKISTVDVCGLDTDICVTKCAVDLFESGIEPRVLSTMCGSSAGPAAHDHALRTLGRYIGKSQVLR